MYQAEHAACCKHRQLKAHSMLTLPIEPLLKAGEAKGSAKDAKSNLKAWVDHHSPVLPTLRRQTRAAATFSC